ITRVHRTNERAEIACWSTKLRNHPGPAANRIGGNAGDPLGFDVFAQRAISPLAACCWLVLMLTPVALVCSVFVQVIQEPRRRHAEQEKTQREGEEAAQRH